MKKQYIIMLYCLLSFILFYGLFHWLGAYSFFEIDEAYYINETQKIFITKEYFLERQPLYFLIELISFKLIGNVSFLSARLPMALLALLPAFLLLFLCKKAKGDKFAIISTMTLFTSLGYMFLAKSATPESAFASFVSSSILFYFYTFYVKEENKKYFLGLSFICSIFAFLIKGAVGIFLPLFIVMVSAILFKTYKKCFKTLMLFLISLVILSFVDKSVFIETSKTGSFSFYLKALLLGLFPHIFVLFSQFLNVRKINFKDKFLTLNLVAIVSILLFTSLNGFLNSACISSIYPFFAALIGTFWFNYINKGDKNVKVSILTLNLTMTISIVAVIFAFFFLPAEMYQSFQKVQLISLLVFIPFVVLSWMFIIKNRKMKAFLTIAIFMSIFSGFLTPYVREFAKESNILIVKNMENSLPVIIEDRETLH